MIAEDGKENFHIFRECLSAHLIAKLCPLPSNAKKRPSRGRKNEKNTDAGAGPANEDLAHDVDELSDFVEVGYIYNAVSSAKAEPNSIWLMRYFRACRMICERYPTLLSRMNLSLRKDIRFLWTQDFLQSLRRIYPQLSPTRFSHMASLKICLTSIVSLIPSSPTM